MARKTENRIGAETSKDCPPLPALVLDASDTRAQVGVLGSSKTWLTRKSVEGPPAEGLFPSVAEALEASGLTIDDCASFIVCAGPGGVLGLRVALMAAHTWAGMREPKRPVYGYHSLQLVAKHLQTQPHTPESFYVVADWKRDCWNALKVSENGLSAPGTLTTEAIEALAVPVYHLPQRRAWATQRPNLNTVAYTPEIIADLVGDSAFFTKQLEPTLMIPEGEGFVRWEARRHTGK